MSDLTALPLALTLGEPAGIGPDLTIQLWHRRIELRLPAFYLIADPEFIKQPRSRSWARRRSKRCKARTSERRFRPRLANFSLGFAGHGRTRQARRLKRTRGDRFDPARGRRRAGGTSSCHCDQSGRQERALPIRICRTGPYRILGQAREESTGKAVTPVMMLWSPELAVVPVTIHLPFRDVVTKLTSELVVETARDCCAGPYCAFRHFSPAHCCCRSQPTCWRTRSPWRGGREDRGAGGETIAG